MKPNIKKLLILNAPYLLFVYLFDKVGQAVRLSPGADLSGKLVSIGSGFSAAFSNALPSFNPMDLLIGIVGAVVIRLAVYVKGKNAKKYRKGMEYGSARWGNAEDMERAGNEDTDPDAERRGLGTPATRAAVIEKLVKGGFIERKGKQLLPTKDGTNLVCVLPDSLTSPQLTAAWENNLTQIAKGNADPAAFMQGIEAMTQELVKTYASVLGEKQELFKTEKTELGKCPRCKSPVYEGKKNYYCSNKECGFTMWKNDRFFEERKTAFTPKIAAALLKSGKATVKKLYSPKTGKTYDGTVLLADTGGKYVNYKVTISKNKELE